MSGTAGDHMTRQLEGPGTVTVHGTDTPNSAAADVFGPGMNSTSYAGCAAASPGVTHGSP
jgi:hypothetical protein